ncbi:MAG: undecaprenyl-diphosphate phosphatase [Candidatus Saccharicenans sp.]|nr:undecaprenyl-diphosphate phosphatase [Candidatus Saccharicenans sp.]MDI6848656.1 undecaprenyl-diphosphate phosphatase [Candidatus Saccharicenans sp.]
MNYFQALVLGFLQGLGEFLPISSSAHLVIGPYFFNWNYQGLRYDVMLHLGTLLAIAAYFWKDWIKIIVDGLTGKKGPEGRFLFYLLLATVPGALAGYFLEEKAETVFREPQVIAGSLIFFSLFIFLADRLARNRKGLEELSLVEVLLIGLAQSLAIVPGASRSGMTIMMALFLGYRRQAAARFSFLLATPVIVGAALLELPKIALSAIDGPFIAGFLSSALFGFLSIGFLLSFLKTRNLVPFVVYRLVLALLILFKYFL